jgi:hypothetical protein
MAKCMQCGGMKKAKVGTVVDDPSKKENRQWQRQENKMDRQDKRFMRKYERQLAKDERKANKIKAEELMKSDRWKTAGTGKAVQMKKGGITQNIVGMPGYNATTRPTTMKKGGVKLTKRDEGGIQKMKYVPGGNKTKADQATVMNPNIYASGGSSTPVQKGCPPGYVRKASGIGCTPMGTR